MRELILKLFREHGTMGVRVIAEVMGESFDVVRHEVNRMTEDGLLIKCGSFMWKIPDASSKVKPKPAVVLPEVVISRKNTELQYDPDELSFRSSKPTLKNGDDRTIEQVLDDMRKRLKSKPVEVENLKQKITVLEGLADITESPISSILCSIGDDLTRMASGG